MFALAVIVPLTVPDLELLSDLLSVTFGVKLISIVRLKVEETKKCLHWTRTVRVNICVVVIEDVLLVFQWWLRSVRWIWWGLVKKVPFSTR